LVVFLLLFLRLGNARSFWRFSSAITRVVVNVRVAFSPPLPPRSFPISHFSVIPQTVATFFPLRALARRIGCACSLPFLVAPSVWPRNSGMIVCSCPSPPSSFRSALPYPNRIRLRLGSIRIRVLPLRDSLLLPSYPATDDIHSRGFSPIFLFDACPRPSYPKVLPSITNLCLQTD